MQKENSDTNINIDYQGKYYTCSEGVQLKSTDHIYGLTDADDLIGGVSCIGLIMLILGLGMGMSVKISRLDKKSN